MNQETLKTAFVKQISKTRLTEALTFQFFNYATRVSNQNDPGLLTVRFLAYDQFLELIFCRI